MFKITDFVLSEKEYKIKKDSYLLSKINGARVKKLSLFDNVGQITFWLIIFSGPVWSTVPRFGEFFPWLKVLAVSLTIVGVIFAYFRCARFALQLEFRYTDETGIQWFSAAKSYSKSDLRLSELQVEVLNKNCPKSG